MSKHNFIGTDGLNGIEEKKGSSQLHNLNLKLDGNNDHPTKRQSVEVSHSLSASTDVCEVNSSLINTVILGNCLEKLKSLPDDSVDLIVTDPPYGIKIMSKKWDEAVPGVEIWKECLRVLKPGAFAFIMSSPKQDVLRRNFINIENAGFKTDFDSIYWTYASGCPSIHNIGIKIDRKFGAEREKIARNPNSRENCDKSNTIYESGTVGKTAYITKPATEEARRFDGSHAGFNPKPAVEVIIVAMKLLDQKSYTNQALSNGKGITWLDDCLIPFKNDQVRFPANLLVSDDVLDDTSRYFSLDAWADFNIKDLPEQVQQNLPFLIVPKASMKEKEAGLEKLEQRSVKGRDPIQDQKNVPFKLRTTPRRNQHPTVKPIKLMTYLITMGSREGDIVLDPFCGSGTTCMAAKMLRRNYIGIELSPEYHETALKRIDSVKTVGGEKETNKEINKLIFQNLKLIVGQQTKENPIGVKIALNFYINKVGEIKRRYCSVDIFKDDGKAFQNDLTDFFRKEATRFVEPNKNGGKGLKTKIEIRIKNTPEVAGLCLAIKSMFHGSSPEAGSGGNLDTGNKSDHESEIEDLMPYLPMLLEFA